MTSIAPYISRDEMIALCSKVELIQLSRDDLENHYDYQDIEPDWAVVDKAISHACQVADGYLAGRYALPLQSVPTLLNTWCGDIARYWLHKRRINASEMPKTLQTAYDDALKMLNLVQNGKMHLFATDLTKNENALQKERGAYRVRSRGKSDWSGY
ncbi:DUF1320 domain-containing protein [Moraxella nonliquefaciens]|jgi:hypothetical protein|uniref:gp436 family protein n=1 Tax=Moraxella nonliquefaciens TaxID=478 RepID=UPI001EF54A69|nr:DUF1320 domain-containing protein [Moraxella nonliquefaciens]MCG7412701.1 DUF1320 domain-containing protein [Moraxella nonliquefaciens]